MNISTSSSHPIKHVLSSREPIMVLLKYVLVILGAVMGFLGLQYCVTSLLRPYVYQKDFIQEYLLARAVLRGIDPYLPLPELALRFLGSLPNSVLQHPTPHPPPVAIISLPLGLLSYERAAIVWFLFEMVCVAVSIRLLLRWLGGRSGWALTIFLTFLAFAWTPFRDEVTVGQLMTPLLVLLIGAWLALRSGKQTLGGILLGCLVALKLMAWPIVIFLALRKNWRAVIAAGVTGAIAHLGAALLMGIDRVVHFYIEVSRVVSPLYHGHEANFSLWTIGWRLFEGTGSPVLFGLKAPPLMDVPDVAKYVSLALPAALLGVGLLLALRARSFDAAFSILVCVSLLVNPVAWSHYLILTLIPLVVVGRRLFALDLPTRETWIILALSLLLFIPRLGFRRFLVRLAGQDTTLQSPPVPFAVALLTLIPAVAIIGLMCFVWHLDRTFPENLKATAQKTA
jgi:hypothetical protein